MTVTAPPPLRVIAPRPWVERDAWAVLTTVNGLGPVGFARLVRIHGTAMAVLDLVLGVRGKERLADAGLAPDNYDPQEASAGRRLDPEVVDAILAAARAAERILARLAKLGLQILTLEDPDYPPRLLALEMPPPVLFVRGDSGALLAERSVAVVGTRHPTEAGRWLASSIAHAIAKGGGVVVSGLAVGIDGAAHNAAVEAHEPTVAVLGSGHGALYPKAHALLAERIVDGGGAVISELGPDVPGNQGTFPRRNRVISGLADATVVVEAPRKSGALITAAWALEQGRECFIVPGAIGTPTAAGSLDFLRANHGQARIVSTIPGLLEDLGLLDPRRPPIETAAVGLGTVEGRLAALVADGHATVDDLVATTGLAVATVLSGLTLLEMRGLVAAAYGRYRPHGLLMPSGAPRAARPAGRIANRPP
jgi:DNA processing protein